MKLYIAVSNYTTIEQRNETRNFFFLTAEQSFNSVKCKKTLAGILEASTVGCLYTDPCDTFEQNM